MNQTCMTCGLPLDICACEAIAKEQQKVVVSLVKKRYGKTTTTIIGIDRKKIDLKELAKKLKNKMACGGTVKEGMIELQGDHKNIIKKELISLGFNEDTIEVEGK